MKQSTGNGTIYPSDGDLLHRMVYLQLEGHKDGKTVWDIAESILVAFREEFKWGYAGKEKEARKIKAVYIGNETLNSDTVAVVPGQEVEIVEFKPPYAIFATNNDGVLGCAKIGDFRIGEKDWMWH